MKKKVYLARDTRLGRTVTLLQQALDFATESGMGKVQRDCERLLATMSYASVGVAPLT